MIMKQKIFTAKEINKIYTEGVKSYLDKGYVFNTSTMAGSQGEIARVDLTNSKEVIRIRIQNFGMIDTVKIIIEKFGKGFCKDNFVDYDTIWNDAGEIIKEMCFYEVDTKRAVSKYTDDKNFFEQIKEKRIARYRNRPNNSFSKEIKFNRKIVLGIIKNHKGFKSVKESEIEKVIKHGKYYTIHVNRNGKISTLKIG